MEEQPQTLFERAGGRPFFERLVDTFYEGVRADPVLGPLYPEFADDPEMPGSRRRLTLFLIQYWGGPMDYDAERGHPRLRLRHLPFPIGPDARNRWLTHMTAAVAAATDGLSEAEAIAAELNAYFHPAAEAMRNDTGLPISGATYPTAG